MTAQRLFFRYLYFLLLLSLPVSGFAFSCQDVTEIPVSECEALVELYDSTDGDNWTDNTAWKQTDTPCGWFGIKCYGGGNTVTNIILSFNKLKGVLPDSLDKLSNLQHLKISRNPMLIGEIPESLGNLSNLKTLTLEENQLTGNIPVSLGNLENLYYLNLYYNQLGGEIPSSLGNLSNLTSLILGWNKLTGKIPSTLGNLINLRDVVLEKNQLSGEIPISLGNLINLQYFQSGYNQFSGQIPSTLSSLTSLKTMNLENNKLTGEIPSFFKNLPEFKAIDIHNNEGLCKGFNVDYAGFAEVEALPLCGNPAIQLTSPANGAIDIPVSGYDLTWNPNTAATAHRITLSTKLDFSNFVDIYSGGDGMYCTDTANCITQDILTANPQRYTAFNLKPNTTYYWKVRSSVNPSYWSEVRSFTTGAAPVTGCNSEIQLSDNLCEGLTAYYSFENNANDGSVNSLHGTELGSPTYINGVVGQAVNLSKAGDYIGIDKRIELQNDFSTAFWVKLDKAAYINMFIGGANAADDNLFNFFWINNQDNDAFHGLAYADKTGFDLVNQKWNFIVYSRQGNNLNLYVNGELYSSYDVSSSPTDLLIDYLVIGGDQDCLGGCFDNTEVLLGSMDELMIHNRALSPEEIQTYYNETKPTEFSCTNVTEIPQSECEALVALYDYTGGDNYWIDNTDWKQTNIPCSWFGVDCENNRVTGIRLSSNQLRGSIYSAKLGNFSNLTHLELANNLLVGKIPAELSNLTNLLQLQLQINTLTGEIPELGNFSNLQILNLSRNGLTGIIPSELGNLSNLTELYLNNNELDGNIPAELGNLSSLQILNLSGNNLIGTIPTELENLLNLEFLYLTTNKFTDTIPSELGNLSNLIELHLTYNQLSGKIPAELGNLSNLVKLALYDNQLSGKIPAELGSLSNLTHLYLQKNQLNGEIPIELGNLSNLIYLYLNENQLTGEIPVEPKNFSSLGQLVLSDNQLSGEIPAELSLHP
ncbi:leucine-rich repeat domain-containing protein, partial [Candidatus Albibeggiatoa sp. nov. BB20]|uniref:leucine-rich repeat domain-containing protein n=1 Tax=Candidatus Albibeggiatoa sp. nov. BB20 TaxID=3162723 RepID=UPI0033658D2D